MEEVDSIILHFLRQLNIKIDDKIKNICELPVETIIAAASKCLITISPTIKIPMKLPSGISHRIEVAAQIALTCKDLGYKNDVGYQTFLYHNEADLRQVFMFLIERLPNESNQTTSNVLPTNKKSTLYRDIGHRIAEELNIMWIPPCCKSQTQKRIGDFAYPTEYLTKQTIPANLTKEQIIEKLLKIKDVSNESRAIKIQPPSNPEQDLTINHAVKSDVHIEIKQSLKELKEAAIVLRQKLDMLESERNVMDVEYSQAQKSCERVEADMKNIENILSSIGITEIHNEDNIQNLLERVHSNINVLHRKSEELTSKNLTLKVEIDKVKNSMALSESERNRCKKILITLKSNAKEMKGEYAKKDEQRHQLKQNYDKLKGGNKRIMEIINNVDKQNMEIKKILDDTRQLQKEINTLEGQLDRCFSIADETLFRDAKKDDQAKKAYKLLALLHSECNTIVSLVNDTGALARDIVDLEDNIKTEKAKHTEETLQKINSDLTKIQQEINYIN
ncbi:coiled-coil domain-containing protein 22 homolog isoform X2 [Amyelois transitella]|uniref:coiled-coil domain-containing protein 22 homolog isoform X2 n=1 Tax=Amyelois transitella TaxID=680683 RepID=UPI00298F6FB2|nr:coiled-coil domain-containing protein 22 homolog isoform X2 [Amyelois transitella]